MVAYKLLTRRGLKSDREAIVTGELGLDTDEKTLIVGDGTSTPPRIITDKSTGSFDLTSLHSLTLPETTVNLLRDELSGRDGWSPVFSLIPNGDRVLVQISDWQGGTSVNKPESGFYIGMNGLTEDTNLAIDVRGPSGPPGAPPIVTFSVNNFGELVFTLQYTDGIDPVEAEINEDGELVLTYGVEDHY